MTERELAQVRLLRIEAERVRELIKAELEPSACRLLAEHLEDIEARRFELLACFVNLPIGGADAFAVRRITPIECERLQGFPDGYTDIPWRGKEHAPDSKRYKALGNSMAVPVMRWIGEGIELVNKSM